MSVGESESPLITRDQYGLGASVYAIAANMLDEVNQREWLARDLPVYDVVVAPYWASLLLRAYSIELGLKDILRVTKLLPDKLTHDLFKLWNLLPEGYRDALAESAGVPEEEISFALGHYKLIGVKLRYGLSMTASTELPQTPAVIARAFPPFKALADTLILLVSPSYQEPRDA